MAICTLLLQDFWDTKTMAEFTGLLGDALGYMQDLVRTPQMRILGGLLSSSLSSLDESDKRYQALYQKAFADKKNPMRVTDPNALAELTSMTMSGPMGMASAGVTKLAKAPRMSAAEAEAQGYWHPIGAGKKLPIPVSEMKMELQPIGNLPPKIIASPEKMQGGAITPFSGDRSAAGQNLLGIGDTRFQTPVELQGGYDFMRMQSPTGSVWASEQGAAQSLQNRINEAAKANSGDVYGVYTAMGPESMNFNTMMSDALLEQMKAGKISKKNIAAFDREVRTLRPEWAGVMSPESRAQLETNGALRHAFVNRMQLDEFQNVGFPNIAYTRYAITDPLLLNEPMYSGGLAIGKMKPDAALITNPISPHKTYDTQLAGEYFGGFEQSVPKEVLFPDWYKMRRQIGAPTSGDVRSFQFAKPIQPTNQEWLDNLMNYMGTQKSLLD